MKNALNFLVYICIFLSIVIVGVLEELRSFCVAAR